MPENSPAKLLLINIAGLAHTAVGQMTPNLAKLAAAGSSAAVQPPVPALTSPSQATVLTGVDPQAHGIVANGWYFRELAQVLNWQRSANLLQAEPIWEAARKIDPDINCANLFWRYATHASCDLKVIERPTYWANGRKSPDIYTEPGNVRDQLVQKLGPFPLFRFWGPAAGIESTRWIADATNQLLTEQRYSLVLTYLPHLDYDHQRFGPESVEGQAAVSALDVEAGRVIDCAQANGYLVAVVSDYAFEPVQRPIFLNRVLREQGWITVQSAENGELLEPGASKAFAVCDQQVAHVYVNQASAVAEVATRLAQVDGVDSVIDREEMKSLGIDHQRSGELLAIAAAGCWFAYPYWLDDARRPDFANCVAIHAKPGWDPAELFLSEGLGGKLHLAKRILQSKVGVRAPFDVISTDATRVQGSHGRIPDQDRYPPHTDHQLAGGAGQPAADERHSQ